MLYDTIYSERLYEQQKICLPDKVAIRRPPIGDGLGGGHREEPSKKKYVGTSIWRGR